MDDTIRLRAHLETLARRGVAGQRLPTIRALMQRFALSQAKVENVFAELRARRLISSEVGRGTFLIAAGEEAGKALAEAPVAPPVRSVLILRRVAGTRRAQIVLDALRRRLAADGHETLDITYSDPRHAGALLRSLPRFDGCVVQSSFQPMPIEMLAAIRRKADALVIDGAWLTGTDLDAVGFEWGEAVERAVALLRGAGHRRIALVTTATRFLANEFGLRRFETLRARDREGKALVAPILMPDPVPGDGVRAAVEALRTQAGKALLPFTAMIVWGIDSGAAFREALAGIGLDVPSRVSVVLLGRTDMPEEAAGFFHLVGYRADEQTEGLYRALLDRWATPGAPTALRLMPVHERVGRSVRRVAR